MNAPATAGTSHQGWLDVKAPKNTRNSAQKPERPGSPSEASPPRVKKTARPGAEAARPPISLRSRVCVFAYSRLTSVNSIAVMIPCETIWKTDPVRPGSFRVAIPSMTIPMCDTDE